MTEVKTEAGAGPAEAREEADNKPRNRRPAEAKFAEVKRRLLEISDLAAAEALLGWDQSTYMPAFSRLISMSPTL